MRIASIDLGTNTALLLIAEADGLKTIEDHAHVVRLGEGVDRGRKFIPAAMERTLVVLRQYADLVTKAGVDPKDVVAVATSQARDAQNSGVFFEKVRKETGFQFRILSGSEEAEATFSGALLPETPAEQTLVMDIGGGSTEWKSLRHGGLSMDLGSVRFTERFLKADQANGPVSDQAFWVCRDAVDLALAPAVAWWKGTDEGFRKNSHLLGVAGTVTTLAQWFLGSSTFDREAIDHVMLTSGDVHRMVEELKWRTVSERRDVLHTDQGRADVILAGAMILWRSMELMEIKTCRVSTRGLRYGVLEYARSS